MKTFLFLFTMSLSIISEAQITFQRKFTVGTPVLISQEPDSGFVILGQVTHAGSMKVYIIRTDAYGDTLWTQFTGLTSVGTLIINEVNISPDNAFVISATMNNVTKEAVIIKISDQAIPIWAISYVNPGYIQSFDLCNSPDSGFVMVGTELNTSDIFAAKIDPQGTIVWSKKYETGDSARANFIIPANDLGYLMGGYINETGSVNKDLLLMKIDSAGTLLWSRKYGIPVLDENGVDAITDADGNFMVTGNMDSYTSGDPDILLMKIDSSGNQQWSKSFGGFNTDSVTQIRAIPGVGFYIAGFSNSFGLDYDSYLIKCDTSGSLLWSGIYGTTFDEKGSCVSSTMDGGIVAGGTVGFPGIAYLVKTDSTGTSGCMESNVVTNVTGFVIPGSGVTVNESPESLTTTLRTFSQSSGTTDFTICSVTGLYETSPDKFFKLYPNPATNVITIAASATGNYEFCIYDSQSRQVTKHLFSEFTSVEVENFTNGLYFCEVRSGDEIIFRRKFAVVR